MYMATVEESILDILLTPIGSRVCLPEYGSRLHELVDRRIDDEYRVDLTRFVYEAVSKWEHRVTLKQIRDLKQDGDRLSFCIEFTDGTSVTVRQ